MPIYLPPTIMEADRRVLPTSIVLPSSGSSGLSGLRHERRAGGIAGLSLALGGAFGHGGHGTHRGPPAPRGWAEEG